MEGKCVFTTVIVSVLGFKILNYYEAVDTDEYCFGSRIFVCGSDLQWHSLLKRSLTNLDENSKTLA